MPKTPRRPGLRNPIAPKLRDPQFRKKIAKSGVERAEQADPFSKKAKHKGAKLDETKYVMGLAMTPENYVIQWVKRGRHNNRPPLAAWEQAFQDAGMIEMARRLGYIHISGNAACDISLEDRGKELVAQYYNEAKPQNLDEFYQVGDKVDIVNGPLKKVLDRAEKLRKEKLRKDGVEPGKAKKKPTDHAIVREPLGPAGTIGITLDGEYHIVDEEDVKLIYEAFEYEELTEWSYAETTAGIRVPISSEEQDILKMCAEPVLKRNMDDREQEVARRMVSRGVLHRQKNDDGAIYFVGDNKKLTRF